MKKTLKTEWNKIYIQENNIITVERTKRLSISTLVTKWGAMDEYNNTLAKVGYYTEHEIDTIENLLKDNGFVINKRVASSTNLTIFRKA